MKELQSVFYESREINYDRSFPETRMNSCRIYFRFPFTGYFLGKEELGKFYLYRKQHDGEGYYFWKI